MGRLWLAILFFGAMAVFLVDQFVIRALCVAAVVGMLVVQAYVCFRPDSSAYSFWACLVSAAVSVHRKKRVRDTK